MFKETLEVEVKILGKYSKFIISQDPIVGGIPTAKKIHSGGVLYKSENEQLQVPLGMMSSVVTLSKNDIYDFDLEKICIEIYEFSQSFLRDMRKTMLTTLTQVTDFTGNVVDAKGKGFSKDVLLDLLDKIYIDFDAQGVPQLAKMLLVNDATKFGTAETDLPTVIERFSLEDDSFKKRYEEIMSKKREAYYAEKGCRGLSRID